MPRVKRGFKARRRRNKVLACAKGFRGTRKSCFGVAVSVVRRALAYAYRDRRDKKRDFRSLWISRINAGTRGFGLKYSQFMYGLKKSGIEIDRSILAETAMNDQAAFAKLVETAKGALSK